MYDNIYYAGPPCPHTPTHSFQGDDRYTLLTKYQQRHPQDSIQDRVGSTHTGTLLGEDSWLAREARYRPTDPTDLLREAGIQLKARHYFLTLLAHKS